jgi:hypothetical protein
MISYKYDRERNSARETVAVNTDGGAWAAALSASARPGPARDDAGLTRRRVVDFCRVAAAL